MASAITFDPTVVILQNTSGRLTITVHDTTGVNVDPYELKLDILDLSGTVYLTDTWTSITPAIRITRSAVGQFYIDFGTVAGEVDLSTEWIFNWRITLVSGGEQTQNIQKVKIISARLASLIPDLKIMIDKARKLVDEANGCFLGYSEANLAQYIQGGLENINAYQPSLSFTVEDFPIQFRQVLIDSSLVVGVMSETLFAVDTDVPNYSDQGTSFVIAHQPGLAAFLNALVNRLDKMIPSMKLQCINPGTMHIQMGPNYRYNTLVSAAPGGASFRGVVFKW